jgi:hypothetical protein
MPFDVSTIFKIIEESILPNIFQNDFSSTEGVAPPNKTATASVSTTTLSKRP